MSSRKLPPKRKPALVRKVPKPKKAPVQKQLVVTEPTLEWVTPELAGDWLAHNTHNRKVHSIKVSQYAEAMKAGHWTVVSDAIGFDESGTLVNGQHRLLAVIESGVPQQFLVVRGLPKDSFVNTDIPIVRTLGDMLYVSGYETNSSALGAALRGLWRWRIYDTFAKLGRAEADREEMKMLLEDEPQLQDHVTEGLKISRKLPGGPGMWIVLRYLIGEEDENAQEFFQSVYSGENLKSTSPIYRLRERLLDKRSKMKIQEFAALVIKAWKLWLEGAEIKILTWNERGGEEFPAIKRETREERANRILRERRAMNKSKKKIAQRGEHSGHAVKQQVRQGAQRP